MRNGQRLKLVVPALVILATLLACSRPESTAIDLPSTPVIDIRPTWAVITQPYVRLRDEPVDSGAVSNHLRRGDVAEIISIDTGVIRIDGAVARWFLLEGDGVQGWAPSTVLESFVSEIRARNVASRLLEE